MEVGTCHSVMQGAAQEGSSPLMSNACCMDNHRNKNTRELIENVKCCVFARVNTVPTWRNSIQSDFIQTRMTVFFKSQILI